MYPITKYHTFFPRPIFDTKTIENDSKLYPITKYHIFFPKPIFETKTIENDLKWFEILILMLEKKVCILLLNTTPFFQGFF